MTRSGFTSSETPSSTHTRPSPAPTAHPTERLSFTLSDGSLVHHFLRQGGSAAHLSLRGGPRGRFLCAFPAGNSGIAFEVEGDGRRFALELEGELDAVEEGALRGVQGRLRLGLPEATLHAPALGSLRALRDTSLREVPSPLRAQLQTGVPWRLTRRTACGQADLELHFEPTDGTRMEPCGSNQGLRVRSDRPGAALRFRALTSSTPLTPIPRAELLRRPATHDEALTRALGFLAYEEKLLAGSWRFLTYFGRDTLLTALMLAETLTSRVLRAALGSVLDKLGPDGEVAHEESVGEWPQLHGLLALGGEAPEPHDFGMVDDDFLLAPALTRTVLTPSCLRSGDGQSFLRQRSPAGGTYGERILLNLRRVVRLATPYALERHASALVRLRDDRPVGEWRDSLDGLGGGRAPWSVNAVLVPSGLSAVRELGEALGDRGLAREATRLGEAWKDVGRVFEVRVSLAEARARLESYAAELGLRATPALRELRGDLHFPGLALDDGGKAIAVLHSDEAFALLLGEPEPQVLEATLGRLLAPFPLGLRTPGGLLVANPVFAGSADLRAKFTADHYHGTVVWAWQQVLLALGLRRQQTRTELPTRTHRGLGRARALVEGLLAATRTWAASELWTFEVRDGALAPCAFGARAGHHDEANALQLWSLAALALDYDA